MNFKEKIRQLLVQMNVPLTVNIRYDIHTIKILRKHLTPQSHCIDIGCHKGEIMDLFIALAPDGHHYGFEPIPELYENLKTKYKNKRCTILPYALSDREGFSQFNLVESNPAYSGLMKRKYDRPHEQDRKIQVEIRPLDHTELIQYPISLIKIDVEGAELGVLKGGRNLILKDRPIIIFEHGLGASDIYGTTPEMIFDFFDSIQYGIWTTEHFLQQKAALTAEDFKNQYYKGINFYFVAQARP
jgi:FkbM family methyltransferase